MSEYYSPTGTMKFLQCPKSYQYYKERWKPRSSISQWMPHILLGHTLARSLQLYYGRIKEGSKDLELAKTDAYQVIRDVIEEEFVEGTEWTIEGLFKLATNGFHVALKTDFPLGGKIMLVDEDIGGFAPDLVYRGVDGKIYVVDHKDKLHCKPEYVETELLKYETSWQFAHYDWAVSERYGEKVEAVGVHLIVLTPKPKAYVHWIKFSQERQEMWVKDASTVWMEMSIAEERKQDGYEMAYRRNWEHCKRYGERFKCEFYVACHELAGDTERMPAFYEKRQGGTDAV